MMKKTVGFLQIMQQVKRKERQGIRRIRYSQKFYLKKKMVKYKCQLQKITKKIDINNVKSCGQKGKIRKIIKNRKITTRDKLLRNNRLRQRKSY